MGQVSAVRKCKLISHIHIHMHVRGTRIKSRTGLASAVCCSPAPREEGPLPLPPFPCSIGGFEKQKQRLPGQPQITCIFSPFDHSSESGPELAGGVGARGCRASLCAGSRRGAARSAEMAACCPAYKWGQTDTHVIVTIDVNEEHVNQHDITPEGTITVEGEVPKKGAFKVQLDPHDEIKVAKCQVNFKARRCATLRLHARASEMRVRMQACRVCVRASVQACTYPSTP